MSLNQPFPVKRYSSDALECCCRTMTTVSQPELVRTRLEDSCWIQMKTISKGRLLVSFVSLLVGLSFYSGKSQAINQLINSVMINVIFSGFCTRQPACHYLTTVAAIDPLAARFEADKVVSYSDFKLLAFLSRVHILSISHNRMAQKMDWNACGVFLHLTSYSTGYKWLFCLGLLVVLSWTTIP